MPLHPLFITLAPVAQILVKRHVSHFYYVPVIPTVSELQTESQQRQLSKSPMEQHLSRLMYQVITKVISPCEGVSATCTNNCPP